MYRKAVPLAAQRRGAGSDSKTGASSCDSSPLASDLSSVPPAAMKMAGKRRYPLPENPLFS